MRYKKIRSLERGIAVLQFLNRAGVATAGEIARHVDLPRPTVYRILNTLTKCGILYRSPSSHKVYRLTEAVGLLSPSIERFDPLIVAVRAVLEEAQSSLPWPVFFSTLSDDGILLRETTRGNSMFWTELGWIGSAAPLWDVAAGRVFPAFAAGDARSRLLASAPAGAQGQLDEIEARGYAEDRSPSGELIGVAVPVGKGEDLAGSLAMFWGPRQDSEEELISAYVPLLATLADQILGKAGSP